MLFRPGHQLNPIAMQSRAALLFFIFSLLLGGLQAFAADGFSAGLDSPGNSFITAAGNSSLAAANKDEFLKVEEAYQLNLDFDNNDALRLNWQIADGYYLYRHGFEVKLFDGDTEIAIEPIIAAGKSKQDEYFGLVEVYYQQTDIDLPAIPKSGELTLHITSQGCADAGLCYPPHSEYFSLDSHNQSLQKLTAKPVASNSDNIATPPDSEPAAPALLLAMMLLAAMGGIILNLMPCVFPILSLKVLAFANDREHKHSVHGLAYTAGVVLSFIAVAGLLISLQAAGSAIGWGFQLQTPWFVAGLAYLFFVLGLNLSGFFEMGGGLMNVGNGLAGKSGYSGSFFTGILATVVASPCTAPFMGTALGFAVTQPALVSLSVFAALGLGMALPVLLLSYSPALLKFIPKPGPWMEKLKQFLAFPLYITAVWLVWVVGKQTGVNGMAAVLGGCILLALALWLWSSKLFSRGLSVASLAVAIALLGSPLLATAPTTDKNYLSYSPATLAELRQQNQPVFLNITADWCITCLANEKMTLSTDTVKQTFIDEGITCLKGDWTNHDPQITALLEKYQRTGIPLYIYYPANQQPEVILPQLLTVSTVVDTIRNPQDNPG